MKQTIIIKIDAENPEPEKIAVAAKLIQNGGLVAFPTETVYGLGADALDAEAVLALFQAKQRPLDNPPIIHVENINQVYKLAEQVPLEAEKLMQQFWPGPLTLVFKRSPIIPAVTVSGLDTVAVRMPKHKVALALIKASGCPIAAPSANLAGKPSPTSAKHVLEDLNSRIDAVLDAGSTEVGVESTVLDVTVHPPMLLRPGGVTLESLKAVLGNVAVHPSISKGPMGSGEKARSPGMRYRHYAPKAQLTLVEGSSSAVAAKVKTLIDAYRQQGKKVGVLATSENCGLYSADSVKCMGSRFDVGGVARNLFKVLREFDSEEVDVIIAEGVSSEGLGLAVMNRLRKASDNRILYAK